MEKQQRAKNDAREAQPEILKICKPLIASTPIRSVSYFEFSIDGSCWYLGSHRSFHDHLDINFVDQAAGCMLPYVEERGFSLTDLHPNRMEIRHEFATSVGLLKENGLGHQCRYALEVDCSDHNCLSIFVMYGAINDPSVNDFYLNNTNLLKQFARYFMKDIRPLKKAFVPFCTAQKDRLLIKQAICSGKNMELSGPFIISSSP